MPVVADLSSNFCSRNIEWDKLHVVIAGAQKNVGPAGCCMLIVRKEFIGFALPETPTMCSWSEFAKSPQKHKNTPCCWAIYMAGLSLRHMKDKGLETIN